MPTNRPPTYGSGTPLRPGQVAAELSFNLSGISRGSSRTRAPRPRATDPGDMPVYTVRSSLATTPERTKIIKEGIAVLQKIRIVLRSDLYGTYGVTVSEDLAVRTISTTIDRLTYALSHGKVGLSEYRLCEEVTKKRV